MKFLRKCSILIILISISLMLVEFITSHIFIGLSNQNMDRCLKMKEKYEYLNCKLIRNTGDEIIQIFHQMEKIEETEKNLKDKIKNDKFKHFEDKKLNYKVFIKEELNQVQFKIDSNEYESTEFINRMKKLRKH